MNEKADIVDKSYKFALEIIKLVNLLPKSTSGAVISNQIMKAGTSIGANVEEAQGASSKKDFTNKMTISKKEARETRYWLRLIKDSGILEVVIVENLIKECDEILKILTAIVKTSKENS
ncbi:MAG: four helix bundle protein [Candidatus Omnitrophica bacterium]|nr:four helix bundle protein [Candidatus Omnitrophota bacterium]